MAKKLTYEEVKSFIELESGSECKLLSSKYVNNATNLQIECNCGNIFSTTYARFKYQNKQGCDYCTGKRVWDYKKIKQYIEVESKSECILMSKGCNRVSDTIKIQCKCGEVYTTKFENFIHNYKHICGKCSQTRLLKNSRKTNKEFTNQVKDVIDDEYVFLEKYINSQTKIKCRHNTCGHEWYITPNNFLRGKRCPLCNTGFVGMSPWNKKSNEGFMDDVVKLVGGEYVFLEEYIHARSPIRCRHSKCGYEWDITPDNFLRGRRCPECSESVGASVAREYLKNTIFNFKGEYEFGNLLSDKGNPLRFDFAVFDYNNSLMLLIEYDGEFHYQDIYKDGSYETLQIHDRRKNEYCKDNNIPLIRIPYWQFDKIEQILDKWLNKYGLIHNEDIKEIS